MPRKAEPEAARAAATEIVKTLRAAGHVAYFAGGCVRDELLGLAPTDYDVATDATPDRIRAIFRRTDEVGAAFGVVLVTLPVRRGQGGGGGKATVEVATFRSDGPYTDRRRPDVIHFSDPEADARRRDYTINALFLDPLATPDAGVPAGARGRVIDYVDGVRDVRTRLLRAVGDPDQRLAEDHLRALRAVRLAAKLGLAIDPATASAIERHAAELKGVSRERIGDELRRIMDHPSRGEAIGLLTRFGLDAPVLDEPRREPPAKPVLGGLRPDAPFPTCLAAWAVDREGIDGPLKELPRRWRSGLCLSNKESGALSSTLGVLALLRRDWAAMTVAKQKRVAVRPGFDAALTLLTLADPAAGATVRKRVEELAASPAGLSPPALLDGDMLVAMGLKPGPRFKRILDAVYDAQLEGRVRSAEEARALARELAGNLGV